MTVASGNTKYSYNVKGCKWWILIVVVVSVLLNIGLLATVGVVVTKSNGRISKCDTAPCVETAAAVANNLNTTHPACSDFYEYACGGYKLHHDPESDGYSYSVWTEVAETFSKRMKMALDAVDESQRYGKQVSALFRSCMDTDAINETSAAPLLAIIGSGANLELPALVGASWDKKKFDLAAWIKTNHEININTFFTFTKGPNPLKPSDVALKVFPSGLNMWKWDYTSDSAYSQKRQEEYRTNMVDLVMKLGATNKTKVTADVADAFAFEVELAKILPSTRDDIYNPRKIRLRRLYNNYVPITRLVWKDYVTAIYPDKMMPDEFSFVFIENIDYFTELAKLISHTSDRTLANYLGTSMLYNLADHLPDHLAGQISAHRRWDYETSPLYYQCASVTEKLMPWAALRAMLDKNLIADKTKATAIFNNLKTELLGQLRAVDGGFSDGFSKLLKDKVTHLHEKLGYPDWILEKDQVNNYYSNMEGNLDATKYLDNVLQMSKFRKRNLLLSTEEQYTDGEGWDTSFGDTAAYYLHGNDIHVPSWYMFAPTYAQDMPDAFNYGGMGAWVGYFMVYALEDDWKKYHDEAGNILPSEISKEDADAFSAVKGCNNYISNMTYLPPGYNTPVPLKMGSMGVEYQHNDIIALNIAYRAFKKNKSGSQMAPALPTSTDKIFFLAMGQFYCETRPNPEGYYHKLLNSVAASRPEFSAAFGCQADDYLYNSGDVSCHL